MPLAPEEMMLNVKFALRAGQVDMVSVMVYSPPVKVKLKVPPAVVVTAIELPFQPSPNESSNLSVYEHCAPSCDVPSMNNTSTQKEEVRFIFCISLITACNRIGSVFTSNDHFPFNNSLYS